MGRQVLIFALLIVLTGYCQSIDLVISCETFGQVMEENTNLLASRITCIRSLKKENPSLLAIDLGNFIFPDYVSLKDGGKAIVRGFNVAGYDLVVLGRREFILGVENLESRLKEADFTAISSNFDVNGLTKARKSVESEVKGKKIVLIGLSSQDVKFDTRPEYVERIVMTDYKEALEKQLRVIDDNAYVVLADNLTPWENIQLASAFPRLNLVLFPKTESVDYVRSGNTHLLGIEPGSSCMTKIHVKNLDAGSEPVVRNLNITSFMQDKAYAEYYKKVLEQTLVDKQKICKIKEHDMFKEITVNILRKLAKAEVGFVNAEYFRDELKTESLTEDFFEKCFPYVDKYCTFKINGAELKKLMDLSAKIEKTELVWAGIKGNKINGKPINDTELYHIATVDFLKTGGGDFDLLKNYPTHKISGNSFKDDLLSYFRDSETIALSDFDYFNSMIKRTYQTKFDVFMNDNHLNTHTGQYWNKNMAKLNGFTFYYIQGSADMNIMLDHPDYILKHHIRGNMEKQSGMEESNRIKTQSSYSPRGSKYEIELKMNAAWHKFNERYPLAANLSYLRKLNFKDFSDSRFGIGVRRNYSNQDKSTGVQTYLAKSFDFRNFTLSTSVDYFHGFNWTESRILDMDNRLSIPLGRNVSWFVNLNNYMYKDSDIAKWGAQRNIMTGVSFTLGGKRI